jgi:hypothetical protein
MPRIRFSTCTRQEQEFVPWMAAAGELSYAPNRPPERDYYFQYSWIVPGVLYPGVNRRRHYWFGSWRKDDSGVRLLFEFWDRARRGPVDAAFLSNGRDRPGEVTAPLAVYRHLTTRPWKSEKVVIMQHGSYLIVDRESQPEIDRGDAVLCKGVQKAGVYTLRRLTSGDVRRRLMRVHARTLEDSVVSFNAVHCNVSRTETGHFNDRTFVLGELSKEEGLDSTPAIVSSLYSGYALEERYAAFKFGPHYVKFRTPLDNIRVTTFVCNETEVKVIDPNKLEVIDAVGCRVREVCV